MSYKTEPLPQHITIILLCEILYSERQLKLIMYLTFTGKVILLMLMAQREAIQSGNVFSSDLSASHATCTVTSSLLACKSHKDAGLACNSQK